MPIDPYLKLLYSESTFSGKAPVSGRFVAILRGYLDNRQLDLIPQRSRAVTTGEVHELIATNETGAAPGRTINIVANLGFLEFTSAGVLVVGDRVHAGGRVLGSLAGFDFTHMPNHMNLVVLTDVLASGEDSKLELGSPVTFTQAE